MEFDAVGFAQAARAQGISDSEIRRVIDEEAQLELGRRGKLQPGEKIDPSTRLQLEKEGVGVVKKPSAAEEKISLARQGALKRIEQLEELYFGKAGFEDDISQIEKGPGALIEGLFKTGEAAIGLNPRLKAFRSLRSQSKPFFAKAAGDVGNLSRSEQDQAVKLIPAQFNSREEAVLNFKEMRKLFSLPEKDFGEGSGKILPGAMGDLLLTEQRGEGIGNAPLRTAFPILQLAKPEGRGAALDVLSLLSLGGFVKGKITGKATGGLRPTKKAVELEREIIKQTKGRTIDGNKLVDAAAKARRNATAGEINQLVKLEEKARKLYGGKKLSVKKAIRLFRRSQKGKSVAGKTGKTAQAAHDTQILETLRTEITNISPLFKRVNKLFETGFKRKKLLRRLPSAGIGVGAGLAGAGLGALLFGRGGNR